MQDENFKHTVDILAGANALAAWLTLLPEIASVLTIVWMLIRIYEWARVRVFKKDGDIEL